MLIDGAPQVVLHAPDADEHFVEVPGVPWPRPPSLAPNFKPQSRMLSWVTMTPRSARINSTSRRLRLNKTDVEAGSSIIQPASRAWQCPLIDVQMRPTLPDDCGAVDVGRCGALVSIP